MTSHCHMVPLLADGPVGWLLWISNDAADSCLAFHGYISHRLVPGLSFIVKPFVSVSETGSLYVTLSGLELVM